MNSRFYELIKKYGRELSEMDGDKNKLKIYLKTDKGCVVTSSDSDFADITDADVFPVPADTVENSILANSKEFNALIVSDTTYCRIMREASREVEAGLDDMAQIVGRRVKVCNYDYNSVKDGLSSATGCLINEKYTVTVGRNLYEAAVALTVLEKCAKVNLMADYIGGIKPISRFDAKLMRIIYKKKYSKAETEVKAKEGETPAASQAPKTAAVFDERELMLRQVLVDYGKKLVAAGLVQGTWGNLSVRLDREYMLVTPSGLDYTRLQPSDMVKVNIKTMEYEGDIKPTSEKGLHGGIYENRPEIGGVIHTHATNCSIFAAARKDVPVCADISGSDEEMNGIFGDLVRVADYGLPGTGGLKKNTIAALGKNSGCIMANHGMICCGKNIEDAFSNCVRLEEYCGSYIENKRTK